MPPSVFIGWLRLSVVLMWFGIVAVSGLTALRIYKQYHSGGKYDALHGGMADFHNGAYYPAMAIRDGVSPYGAEFAEKYPVAKPTPAFLPSILALHIPFSYLPQRTADVVYFLLSIGIFGLIAWLATIESLPLGTEPSNQLLRKVLFPLLLLLILVSRGGHTTLLNGYFTPIIVLGTQLAFQFAHRRHWLAGLGVFLAAGKPTFAIPIGLVMLCRGNWRALFIGVGLSLLGSLLPLLWLSLFSSPSEWLASMRDGQELHMVDPRELPVNTWTRIDLSAIVAKWCGANPSEVLQLGAMMLLMIFPAAALRKLRSQGDFVGAYTMSGAVGLLAILVTLYHHVYDALILVGPIAALTATLLERWSGVETQQVALAPPRFGSGWRTIPLLVLGVALTAPWWNYFSSEIVLTRLPASPLLQNLITSSNAVFLLLALLLLGALPFRALRKTP